jgi:hypothetical protein
MHAADIDLGKVDFALGITAEPELARGLDMERSAFARGSHELQTDRCCPGFGFGVF